MFLTKVVTYIHSFGMYPNFLDDPLNRDKSINNN